MPIPFNGGISVEAQGRNPFGLVITSGNTNGNQIAVIDTTNPKPVAYCRYVTHAFTGEEKERNERKQARRVYVFGEGHISSATMTIRVDGSSRGNAYAYSAQSAYEPEGMIWKQDLLPIIGRWFIITLEIAGLSVSVNEIQVQYIPYS